jgi:hypothetical protein
MRTLFIFIGGLFIGFLLSELVRIFSYLLYDAAVGLKFFPILLGIILVGVDFLLRRKTKMPTYTFKSSFR